MSQPDDNDISIPRKHVPPTPIEETGFGDSSLSELVGKMRQQFDGSKIDVPICEEILDWLTDEGYLLLGNKNTTIGDPVRALESKFRLAMHLLISYQERQKPRKLRPENGVMFTQAELKAHMLSVYDDSTMSTRAICLELGFHTAAGGETPATIAKRFGYKKFTFCKCAESFQERLGFPPRIGQRDDASRKHMSETRLNQLQKSDN